MVSCVRAIRVCHDALSRLRLCDHSFENSRNALALSGDCASVDSSNALALSARVLASSCFAEGLASLVLRASARSLRSLAETPRALARSFHQARSAQHGPAPRASPADSVARRAPLSSLARCEPLTGERPARATVPGPRGWAARGGHPSRGRDGQRCCAGGAGLSWWTRRARASKVSAIESLAEGESARASEEFVTVESSAGVPRARSPRHSAPRSASTSASAYSSGV